MRNGDREGRRGRTSPSVRRRPLLGLFGSLGVAGTLGFGAGSAAAQDDSDDETNESDETDEDDDWETEADERIREHRTADLEVRVVDRNGDPIDGAEVDVAMREHAYGFGTAVNANTLINETEPRDEYRERIPELFNKAVLENQHKWRFWEENRELADEATEWLLERDLDLRGHAALWASIDSAAVPPDVVEALGRTWEDGGATEPDEDPDHAEQRATEHLEAILEHYGDDIVEWDVVNEVIHEPAFARTIDGSDADPAEAPVIAEWYRIADELGDEYDFGVDVNDYNVLTGPNYGTRQLYQDQIEFLLEEGVDVDGIGMQSHFTAGSTLEPDQIMEGLDTYAEYGADLRITEFDMEEGRWSDEEKGEYLHRFLKTVFSHPATTDFVMWGFWDGRHWKDEAPLFYEDWEEKPAYDVYTDLVFDEWWTDETGETDGGVYETTGFEGEYEITARHGDEEATTTATLADDGETVELSLDNEAGEPETIPGLGVGSAVAGLAGLAGYALLRGGSDESS